MRYPQGESNPCRGLERAVSWATRRWGRLRFLDAQARRILRVGMGLFKFGFMDCRRPLRGGGGTR